VTTRRGWPVVAERDLDIDINNLTPEQHFILGLMVSGYTVPGILARCASRPVEAGGPIEVDYGWVVRVYTDFYEHIVEARRLRDAEILDRGLGRRAERLARLEEHAEQLEDKALMSPNWSRQYVDTIETIDRILEPLQKNRLPSDDAWVMLLNQLTKVSATSGVVKQPGEDQTPMEIGPGPTESLADQPGSSRTTYSEPLDDAPVQPKPLHSEAEQESNS